MASVLKPAPSVLKRDGRKKPGLLTLLMKKLYSAGWRRRRGHPRVFRGCMVLMWWLQSIVIHWWLGDHRPDPTRRRGSAAGREWSGGIFFVLKVYIDFTYMTADMGRYLAPISCTWNIGATSQCIILRVANLRRNLSIVPYFLACCVFVPVHTRALIFLKVPMYSGAHV
jgi:hypothetical protein